MDEDHEPHFHFDDTPAQDHRPIPPTVSGPKSSFLQVPSGPGGAGAIPPTVSAPLPSYLQKQPSSHKPTLTRQSSFKRDDTNIDMPQTKNRLSCDDEEADDTFPIYEPLDSHTDAMHRTYSTLLLARFGGTKAQVRFSVLQYRR